MKKKFSLYIRSFFAALHILAARLFNPRGIHSSPIQDISISTRLTTSGGGKLFLKKHIHTRRNVVLEADGGIIEIGEGCFFNNGCMVVAKERVTVGKNTSFGPNVMLYDHDHDIHSEKEIHDSGYVTAPIVIGDNVWVGANSVILRGSVLGKGCVVGAGSLIRGIHPPNSVIVQKRTEETKYRRRQMKN
jgi:acetyltransferase-like isoleucine patch superfamily enzyme